MVASSRVFNHQQRNRDIILNMEKAAHPYQDLFQVVSSVCVLGSFANQSNMYIYIRNVTNYAVR